MLEKCTPILFRIRNSVLFWKLLKNKKKSRHLRLNLLWNPLVSRRLKGTAKTTHTHTHTHALKSSSTTTISIKKINFDSFVWRRRRNNSKAISKMYVRVGVLKMLGLRDRLSARRTFLVCLSRSIEKQNVFLPPVDACSIIY